MIKLKTVQTRPNTGVAWNKTLTPTILNHLISTYVSTGKILCNKGVIDGVTQNSLIIFKDQAAYDEYQADQILAPWVAARTAYNNSNNIVTTSSDVTEIDDTDSDYIYNVGSLGVVDAANSEIPITTFMQS